MTFYKNFYFQEIPGVDDAFGFGETTHTYEERQKMSDYSKAKGFAWATGNESWKITGWWEKRCLINREKHQDAVVHDFYKKIPGIVYKDEVFRIKPGFGLTKDIIKDMTHRKFFSDTPEEKEVIELRKYQEEFIGRAIASMIAGSCYFLLFAKCRAGKSVMELWFIKMMGYKVSLVVSRARSPIQSWKDDVQGYSNFDCMVFIDINSKDYVEQIEYWMKTDKQIILFACVQSKKILDLSVTVEHLVYDEAHVGYDSKQWKQLREVIDCPVHFITGTAYKMVWDFAPADRYIYSYYEEQLDKMHGLNDRPSMKVILAKYESSQYQAIFGNDPDAMKNLFNVDDNGDFIHPELVQDFVTNRFATQRVLRPQNRLLKDATHMYITLPSVAACYAFSKYMEGTRFAPLVATGDSGVNSDDINKHIEENPNGSCILTRTANVLGVTAKLVDTIVNCAEGNSIEFWLQFAFRGGSGSHDWQVIDFCPQRCLGSLRQTYVAACDTSPAVAEYDFTDFINIVEWSEEFIEVSADRVYEILAADVGNAIRLVSGLATTLDFSKLRDLDFNLSLQPSGTNLAKSIELNNNNANGKTNKKRKGELTKAEKDEIYEKIETIQSILERIPLVLYHAIESGELMNNTDAVINSAHYQPVTLDDEKILLQALEHDVINRKALSKRISAAYIDIQHAIKEDDVMTLAELSRSAQSQQPIPVELFKSMIGL